MKIREVVGARGGKLVIDGRLKDGTRFREKVAEFALSDPEGKRTAFVKARQTRDDWVQQITFGVFVPPSVAKRAARAAPPAPADAVLFKDYVARFLAGSANAKPDHAWRLAPFVARWGDREVRSIKRADVKAWLGERVGAVKHATARKDLSALSVLLNDAVEDEVIEVNPVAGIKRPKNDTEKGAAYTDAEVDAILAAARPALRRLLTGFVLTGARSKELRCVRWADYDAKARVLRLVRFKTGNVTAFPVEGRLRALLDDCARQPVQSVGGYVFADDDGRSWASEARGTELTKEVRQLLVDLEITRDGLEPVHSFRHHYGTSMARSGVGVERLQFLMGHKTIGMTAYYFTLVADDVRREAGLAGHSLGTTSVGGARREEP